MKRIEKGAAKIIVSLENGKLTVNHGQASWAVLHERDADAGIWDALWNVIRDYEADHNSIKKDQISLA
jgi:hypothetical protein